MRLRELTVVSEGARSRIEQELVWQKLSLLRYDKLIRLLHVNLYVCSFDHDIAELLDGVAELPDTQALQQTDLNES